MSSKDAADLGPRLSDAQAGGRHPLALAQHHRGTVPANRQQSGRQNARIHIILERNKTDRQTRGYAPDREPSAVLPQCTDYVRCRIVL